MSDSTVTQSSATSHEEMLQALQRSMRVSAASVSANTQDSSAAVQNDIEYPSRALYLIQAWRMHGHLHADLDPLKQHPSKPSPEMELAYYGLNDDDLDRVFPTGDLVGPAALPLKDILDILQRTYSGHIAPELMHIMNTSRRQWMQQRLEGSRSTPTYDDAARKHLFSLVMKAEEFERFLHTRYTGQKRFSLEGGESLVPMLDALIQRAGNKGVKEIILGMAHRGRLNVLANVLGKSLTDIFSEFEGDQFNDADTDAGDVKYHMGFSSDISTAGGTVHLSLGFNPSHLEIISPVVLGSVRARQCRRKDKARREVMGVLIHGDAAFAGQGVVAESLNLGDLSGYRTGGTIHIVINNQIGFTTNPFDARSTFYCTDVAKLVQAPILHVNGDDPEACCMAMELAMDYKHQFRSDVVIDLVCYRRLGHNEADAPEVTQPMMYGHIRHHETVQHLYRRDLAVAGVLSEEEAIETAKHYRECLDSVRKNNIAFPQSPNTENSLQGRWQDFVREHSEEPVTAVDEATLKKLVRRATQVPDDFRMHPKVQKIYDNRIKMIDGQMPIDWGCAEIMAYASLLQDGGWIRLTGQDTGRGTFFHRHAIVYDQDSGKGFIPLRQLESGELSRFLVIDSMLSEMAVMAYEYGYSVAEPRALVIWEAQYGDFANMAQVVIDQFIAAGASKWNRMSGLVLWLPHGYEGQGAEHSSARLERFLQLCANDNMQIVCPTTPAQLFHLFRRQYLLNSRKPMIMMGPKSMLRHKASVSTLEDLTSGSFQPVLAEKATAKCRRVILCSGKVYYDLIEAREKQNVTDVNIIRLERLYPFPATELKQALADYTSCKEVLWLQEEPENQGAWFQINSNIRRILQPQHKLYGLARPALAAPAVGSLKRHNVQKETLLTTALAKDVAAFMR
ncbi:MAG: 2-oxoglutarate dehydrogenase E1 component [Mariprofundaceae bacterium]|nr:2-oxoglutarate dehydrogenase E1 component [Mariprofundaceae bacterium]